MKSNISTFSRMSLVLSAACFLITLVVPIWGIYLVAPQYPEGLSMQIWVNQISGSVDIINGLNHYIGMREIHADDFLEFKVLPYVFIIISLTFAYTAFNKKRSWLYVSYLLFILFAIVSAYDFWKWEYDYGHNLDPNAAIKVPGMVYQPPLIGHKQLLNFDAYSVPEIGGWLLIGVGVLLTLSIVIEMKTVKQLFKKHTAVVLLLLGVVSACNSDAPVPLNLNVDACSSCKMTVSDENFGAEIITQKGRCYKFDDLACLLFFIENQSIEAERFYVNDYGGQNLLIDAKTAWFVQSPALKSPMGGSIAAFSNRDAATKKALELHVKAVNWTSIQKINEASH